MSDDEVPSTTEELYKYMQENTKGGHYGFVEQHSTAYYAAGWLHAFGGYILNENGEPGLDDENTIKALEYHKKFVELMPTEGEYSTVNTLFREGKAHSTIGGPWLVPTARESGIDLGIAPMPTVDETGNKIAPYSGVQGIHVLKVAAERKHDAIAKVLQVLTNDSVGIAMAKQAAAPLRSRVAMMTRLSAVTTWLWLCTIRRRMQFPCRTFPKWTLCGRLRKICLWM